MIVKLLLALLIILIVFLFLIFFKSWHIHIIFKNDNLDYFYRVIIKFLLFNITLFTVEKIVHVMLQIHLFTKTIKIFELKLNEKSSESHEDESSEENVSEEEEDTFEKIRKAYPLFADAKSDLYSVINLLVKMLKFDESFIIMNLGLSDNNLTIKTCAFLWTFFAPLYPLGLKLYLTPEINRSIIKTDINVKFDMLLSNILRILFLVIRSKRLRDIIKFFKK